VSNSVFRRRIRGWGRRQLYSIFSSLGTLMGHRISTLMTVLVLGIAMLLPLGLYVALENLDRFDLKAEELSSITVFLKAEATDEEAMQLAGAINAREDAEAAAISPQQGLEEFRTASGFGRSLDVLEENPLPWVLMVQPVSSENVELSARVAELSGWLEKQPAVETIQVDSKWLQRLAGLLELGRALVAVLAVIFSVAVLVVIANTIRLDVANRSDEIEVLSLVGAENGFIRQPFLYSGLWYGLLGAVLAVALLLAGLGYLRGPMQQLLDSYGNSLPLTGISLAQVALVVAGGGFLGLIGAWLAVERYLSALRRGGPLGRL